MLLQFVHNSQYLIFLFIMLPKFMLIESQMPVLFNTLKLTLWVWDLLKCQPKWRHSKKISSPSNQKNASNHYLMMLVIKQYHMVTQDMQFKLGYTISFLCGCSIWYGKESSSNNSKKQEKNLKTLWNLNHNDYPDKIKSIIVKKNN